MRIRWSSDLETGVRAIDRQHEELIGMLNELDAAHAGGCPQSVLDDVLQRLGTYVIFHFGTEEALMAGLPHNEEHARQHRHEHAGFIEKLAGLRAQGADDGRQTMEALIDYLNEWLYQHILKSDRELAALLNRKQAARPLP
jgi:hemerythrin